MTPLQTITQFLDDCDKLESAATEGPWAINHKFPREAGWEEFELLTPTGGTLLRFTNYGKMRDDAFLLFSLRNTERAKLAAIKEAVEFLDSMELHECACGKLAHLALTRIAEILCKNS